MELDPIDKKYKAMEKNTPKGEESKKISCPNCGHSASASDINIQDKIAKCVSCDEVFSFQNALQSLLDNSSLKEKRKPRLGKQMDVDIFEYKGELSISITNFTDWIAIIIFFVSIIGIIGTIGSIDDFGMSVLPFGISFFMILAYSIFRFLSWRKNKTYIDVDDQYLYVKNRPRNFKKDKAYTISHIRQFYSKNMPGHEGHSSGYFHVWMIYDGPEGEQHVKVTPYLRSRSRALYIEQELEKYLDLADEEVPEEFRPTGV